ncbi:DUF4097 family beta strand repeat-containing protein [Streptomyces sp. NPDC002187]|uniref:DUF4097 family beta strand repeat-containing protein n=1 Tax=Streptomyces sp. NPDC002187 TaxID=3364637 RepID=UPI0036ADCB04
MITMAAQQHGTRALLAAGILGVVAFGVAGCGRADADDAPVERKSFAFSGETLTVDSDESAITLVPADVKDVQVARQIDGWAVFGGGPEATWKMQDGTLTLRVDCDGISSDCASRHTVKVPRGVAVNVDDDNGSVTASGFDTALKIRSDNGTVRITDSSGPLELDSDNGEVVTEGVTAKRVVATSDNGSVRLGLAAVPDRVESASDNGEVLIELPGAGAPYAVSAKSDNGDIDVDVPTDDSSAHIVTARSDNGKVIVRTTN